MSPSNHRFLSIPLLPREERVLSREEREEENDDDLRLTTDILNGVILTSLCMFLVALSFAMIFVSDHIFAVIFLACLNVFFTAPIISLTETKIMEQVTVEKSIRRLERDVKKLMKENENKREREWELEKKRDKLEEYEELLEAIVDLQVRIFQNSLFVSTWNFLRKKSHLCLSIRLRREKCHFVYRKRDGLVSHCKRKSIMLFLWYNKRKKLIKISRTY